MLINDKLHKQINEWLAFFAPCQVECDGMTRLISTALSNQRVEHKVKHGYLKNNQGDSILHYWVELSEDHIVDLRARIWMGDSAPHGLFENKDLSVTYEDHGELYNFDVEPFLFMILSDLDVEDVPPFPSAEPANKNSKGLSYPDLSI